MIRRFSQAFLLMAGHRAELQCSRASNPCDAASLSWQNACLPDHCMSPLAFLGKIACRNRDTDNDCLHCPNLCIHLSPPQSLDGAQPCAWILTLFGVRQLPVQHSPTTCIAGAPLGSYVRHLHTNIMPNGKVLEYCLNRISELIMHHTFKRNSTWYLLQHMGILSSADVHRIWA